MKGSSKKILYILSIMASAILFVLAAFISRTHQAANSSADELAETLNWFQISNGICGAGAIILSITLIFILRGLYAEGSKKI